VEVLTDWPGTSELADFDRWWRSLFRARRLEAAPLVGLLPPVAGETGRARHTRVGARTQANGDAHRSSERRRSKQRCMEA